MNQKKNFNKVAKQEIFILKKPMIGLKALIPAENEEVTFLYENNLPNDLKGKRSLASFAAKP